MSSRGKGFDSNESPRPTRPAPWYALPVGWLCRDDRGAIWGWLSIVCLFLKWVSVAYSTSGPVATYILLASLSTQLGWYFIFVLLGRKSHKYLHQELPFTRSFKPFGWELSFARWQCTLSGLRSVRSWRSCPGFPQLSGRQQSCSTAC